MNILDIEKFEKYKHILDIETMEFFGKYLILLLKKNPLNNYLKLLNIIPSSGGGISDYNIYFFNLLEYNNIDTNISFVIKEMPHNDESINELEIGRRLNQLRDEIPNYVYTFGSSIPTNIIFNPYYNEYDEIVLNNYIETKKEYLNIILENITGELLSEIINNIKFEDLINIILQIIFTLIHTNRYFQFSHNDINQGNIIVTKLDKPKIIRYKLYNRNVTLKVRYLVKIIDFGLSSLKDGDIHLYNKEYIYRGVEYDDIDAKKYEYFGKEPFPVGDIFKLFIIISHFTNKNKEIRTIIKDMVLYILSGDMKLCGKYIDRDPDNENYIIYGYIRKYDKESFPSLENIEDYIFEESKLKDYIKYHNNDDFQDLEIMGCKSKLFKHINCDDIILEKNEHFDINIDKNSITITLSNYLAEKIYKMLQNINKNFYDKYNLIFKENIKIRAKKIKKIIKSGKSNDILDYIDTINKKYNIYIKIFEGYVYNCLFNNPRKNFFELEDSRNELYDIELELKKHKIKY